MEILWLAIVIYSIGLGVLLHFRPAYMFHENGTWKEFGYQRDSRHTLFPFWLFAIAWAFMSYVLAATIVWSFFTPMVSATAAATAANYASASASALNRRMPEREREPEYEEEEFLLPASNVEEEEEEEEEEEQVKDVRIKRNNVHYEDGKLNARPGYYVIDPSSRSSGIRRYIYYGPSPPTD